MCFILYVYEQSHGQRTLSFLVGEKLWERDWYINFVTENFLTKFYPKKVLTVCQKYFRGQVCYPSKVVPHPNLRNCNFILFLFQQNQIQNIIVGQQQNYLKTAMKTISGSSNWYFIKKEALMSFWYVYLLTTNKIVGPKGQFFCTELDRKMEMKNLYVNFKRKAGKNIGKTIKKFSFFPPSFDHF